MNDAEYNLKKALILYAATISKQYPGEMRSLLMARPTKDSFAAHMFDDGEKVTFEFTLKFETPSTVRELGDE